MSEGVEPARVGFELGCDGAATIVVGVDGTDPSWRALHFAVGLARRELARVVAVHAESCTPVAYGYFGEALAPPPPPGGSEAAQDLAASLALLAREHDIDLDFRAVAGDPVAALIAVAEEEHADMIVVGASSKPTHRLFGSASVRTVRARRCPVTVVP